MKSTINYIYPRLNFKTKIAEIMQVYESAKYGSLLREFEILNNLIYLRDAEAIEEIKSDKYKVFVEANNFLETKFETNHIRNAWDLKMEIGSLKGEFSRCQSVPKLNLEQALVTLCICIEEYFYKLIKLIHLLIPETLKSSKTTLDDKNLIDSLLAGNTIEVFVEKRIKDFAYGSFRDWLKYIKNLGIKMNHCSTFENACDNLEVMFITRNCLVHNNNKVNQKLSQLNQVKYSIEDEISITEDDILEFRDSLYNFESHIDVDLSNLLTKRNLWEKIS